MKLERILAKAISVERSDGLHTLSTELTIPYRLGADDAARAINTINSAIFAVLNRLNFECLGPAPSSRLGYHPDHPQGQPFEPVTFTYKGDVAGTYTDINTGRIVEFKDKRGLPAAPSHPLSAVHAMYDSYYSGHKTRLSIEIEINSKRASQYERLLKAALDNQIDNFDMDGLTTYRKQSPWEYIFGKVASIIERGKETLPKRLRLAPAYVTR